MSDHSIGSRGEEPAFASFSLDLLDLRENKRRMRDQPTSRRKRRAATVITATLFLSISNALNSFSPGLHSRIPFLSSHKYGISGHFHPSQSRGVQRVEKASFVRLSSTTVGSTSEYATKNETSVDNTLQETTSTDTDVNLEDRQQVSDPVDCAGTFGDIMAHPYESEVDVPFGLSTSASASPSSSFSPSCSADHKNSTLSSRFGDLDLTPLERVALTANGNLQRIFSSFYDVPVVVHVDRCELREDGYDLEMMKPNGARTSGFRPEVSDDQVWEGSMFEKTADLSKLMVNAHNKRNGDSKRKDVVDSCTWDRLVHLTVHGQKFCTATSVVKVHDPTCIHLIQRGKVGIGQLFRYLDKLPTFTLLDAGRMPKNEDGIGEVEGSLKGGLWRLYELTCEELTCTITEVFEPNAWEIQPLWTVPQQESRQVEDGGGVKGDHYFGEDHDNTF